MRNISEILTMVEEVVDSCRKGLDNLPQLLIKFNFLIGTNQCLDYSQLTPYLGDFPEEEMSLLFHLPPYNPTPQSVAEAPWEFVDKQLLPMIEILIQGGEEAGSITTQGLLILACHKVFNWITMAKSKLTTGDWGNVTRSSQESSLS